MSRPRRFAPRGNGWGSARGARVHAPRRRSRVGAVESNILRARNVQSAKSVCVVKGTTSSMDQVPDIATPRFEDQSVDTIEPAERSRVHRDDAMSRETAVELCGERLASERRRLRNPGQQKIGRAARVTGDAERDREAAERSHRERDPSGARSDHVAAAPDAAAAPEHGGSRYGGPA